MAKVALLGHGVVGSGVAEGTHEERGLHSKARRRGHRDKYILDIRDFPGLEYSDRLVRDYDVIEHDPEIEVVIEVIGGIKPAYEFVSRAILAGKSVVTSNKELVAARGAQLLGAWRRRTASSSCSRRAWAGAIPIIRPMHQCLAANELDGITGILNGTTNYILTQDGWKDGAPFGAALRERRRSWATPRANPAADVEGIDAGTQDRASSRGWPSGRHVDPADVHTSRASRR